MSSGAHNKYTDAAGKRFNPSAYKLESITLANHKGMSKDIENIVPSFKFTESLYSPSLIAEFDIGDSVNLFEEFQLCGQETITVKLGYLEHETDIEKNINLKFYVMDYPTYGRPDSKENMQVYKIKGISEQAYISSHKKISRAYEYKKTSDIIKNILERDCNLTSDAFAIYGEGEALQSKIKWLCTYQTPLQAIESLRARSYDAFGAPYYLYASIDGMYHFKSHTDIVNAPLYNTYRNAKQFSSEPQTAADYLERSTRILACASSLKLSKVAQAQAGAYGSTNYTLDYTQKNFGFIPYNYTQDFDTENTLEGKKVLSEQFGVSNGANTPVQTSDMFQSAHVEYTSLNTGAYKGNTENPADEGMLYNDLTAVSLNKLNSYRALSNTTTHDLVLNGDLNLNPGRKIELVFPKAIDPEVIKDVLDKSDADVIDKTLSGKYFIAGAEHVFKMGDYKVNLKVKRDSFRQDLTEE